MDSITLKNHSGGCYFPLHPSRGLRFLNSSSISFLSLFYLWGLSPFLSNTSLLSSAFHFLFIALHFITLSPLSILYLSILRFSLSVVLALPTHSLLTALSSHSFSSFLSPWYSQPATSTFPYMPVRRSTRKAFKRM